ncbi:MAG TPA: WecB/TagA/CpsF family glycosyltransferase [Candidatus Saccharimonadales bacterium]|nr:WecB/TagA/CpsF family glycosyltransferase [Candidatus Saccharimonadales bacterium]
MTRTPEGPTGAPTVSLDGWAIQNVTLPEAADLTAALAEGSQPSLAVTPNAQHMRLLRTDPEFQAAYGAAAVRFADGMPLVWASKLQGTPLKERIAGSDLEPALCARLQKCGGRALYIGGATQAVNDMATANRSGEFPGLEVYGVSPSMEFGSNPKEDATVVEFINDLSVPKQPTAVFVCAGAPKSEIWASKQLPKIRQGVILPVGAAIDFAAGTKQRASDGMQTHGLEWLHRMAAEPRRLGPRYARDALFLAGLMGRSLAARASHR